MDNYDILDLPPLQFLWQWSSVQKQGGSPPLNGSIDTNKQLTVFHTYSNKWNTLCSNSQMVFPLSANILTPENTVEKLYQEHIKRCWHRRQQKGKLKIKITSHVYRLNCVTVAEVCGVIFGKCESYKQQSNLEHLTKNKTILHSWWCQKPCRATICFNWRFLICLRRINFAVGKTKVLFTEPSKRWLFSSINDLVC